MQICFEQGEKSGINFENIIEAVLFSSGEPVSFAEIAEALEIKKSEAGDIIIKFAESYNLKNTGLEVIILEDNAQLIARVEHIDYIKKVLKSGTRQMRVLSKSALEILAIVAYHQPITRSYIEQIRGVDCTYMLGSLIERGYIEEKGVLEVPGRPKLYGTTIKFLAQFGLSDLSELPEIEKFRESLMSGED
jgi:segregation and condensation protein B